MTYHSQWFAVEILDIATLRRSGATSVQYKKFAPRNPIGMKKLKRKTNNTLKIWAAMFDSGKEVAIARPIIQVAILGNVTIHRSVDVLAHQRW